MSQHIDTELNYRSAFSWWSDFPAYWYFSEVYHGGRWSKAALSRAWTRSQGKEKHHIWY